MELMPGRVWGNRLIRPLHNSDESAKAMTVFTACDCLDLSVAIQVQLYRLVSFSKPLADWRRDRLLTIRPRCKHLEMSDYVDVWPGADAELKAEQDKLEKQRENYRKRNENAITTCKTTPAVA